jgi:hypothetical protein
VGLQAISEYQNAADVSQNSLPALAALGYAYGVSGNQDEARRTIARLRETSKRRYVSAFDMAVEFAGIGDRDSTFQWLEKAYADRKSNGFSKLHPATRPAALGQTFCGFAAAHGPAYRTRLNLMTGV